MSETQLVSAILEVLARDPLLRAWRNNTGRKGHVRFGLGVGSADIIGVLAPSGRFLALEVKTDSGEQSKEQIGWGKTVDYLGGYYAVVRSVGEALAHVREAKMKG